LTGPRRTPNAQSARSLSRIEVTKIGTSANTHQTKDLRYRATVMHVARLLPAEGRCEAHLLRPDCATQ